MRGDVELAINNAQRGIDAVLAQAERIERELPGVSVETIRRLPDIGRALAYAAARLERFAPPAPQATKLLARGRELRGILLRTADALVAVGLMPGAAVARLHKSTGGLDIAGDCMTLPEIFKQHEEAIRGKSPVTDELLQESAEVGTSLLAVLQPTGARRKPASAERNEVLDVRERFWTLFARTWETQVWRSGAWLFGQEVDAHVPTLLARAGRKRTAKPAPAPSPIADTQPKAEETQAPASGGNGISVSHAVPTVNAA